MEERLLLTSRDEGTLAAMTVLKASRGGGVSGEESGRRGDS